MLNVPAPPASPLAAFLFAPLPTPVPLTNRRVHRRNYCGTPRHIRPQIAWDLESELSRDVTPGRKCAPATVQHAYWTWCNNFTTIAYMPTMHKESDWAIRVNGDEPHPLPHVHVGFRDGSRVSVCIETVRVLVGSIRPPARLAPALEWIAAHQEVLFAEYRRLNP